MTKEWWKTFFDENYVREWQLAGMFKYTSQEVDFLEKVIPLRKTYEILDLCCGHGRHSIELAKRGYKVAGLDFSSYELKIAKNEAERKNLAINFAQGDARNFKFQKKFDVVINMFTAFGYGSRKDDHKIVQNVSRILKKGGKFFIDIQSLPWLWKNFKPVRREKLGHFQILKRRTYDFIEGINHAVRTVSDGDHKRIYRIQTRNYTLTELKDLLAEEKLKIIKFFGSYKGEPFGWRHKRMLVLAKKQ